MPQTKLARVSLVQRIVPLPEQYPYEIIHTNGFYGGRTVIALKGMFSQGSKCLYIEPGSFIPVGIVEGEPWNGLYYPKTYRFPNGGPRGYYIQHDQVPPGISNQGLILQPQLCRLEDVPIKTDVTERLSIVPLHSLMLKESNP